MATQLAATITRHCPTETLVGILAKTQLTKICRKQAVACKGGPNGFGPPLAAWV